MAVTRVQSVSNYATASTVTLTFGSAPSVGSLLVAMVSSDAFFSGGPPLVAPPAGWNQINSHVVYSTTLDAAMYYRVATSADVSGYASGYVFSGGSYAVLVKGMLFEVSGQGGIDTSNTWAGLSTSISSGSVTPSTTSSLILASLTSWSGTNYFNAAPTGGFTSLANHFGSSQMWCEYLQLATTSTSAQATSDSVIDSGSYNGMGMIVVIKGAPVLHTAAVSDTSLSSDAVTSSVTVALVGPVNTVPPAVTGTAHVGSTLSCTTGTWGAAPTPITPPVIADGSGAAPTPITPPVIT